MSDTEKSKRGLGRTYLRGRTWWIQYSFRGRKVRESAESDQEKDAIKLLKKRLGEMGRGHLVGPQAERTSFTDLAKMIRDDYAINGRKSAERLESSLLHLEDFFGLSRVPDMTTDRIQAYVRSRLEGEPRAKPATVKNELSALKRALHLARLAGRIADVPAFPTIEVRNTRSGFAEDPQVRAIVAALPEHYGHVVTFLHVTGWRMREAIDPGLAWNQVDLDGGWIRLEPGTTKNDDGRAFPLAVFPELRALMQKRRALTDAMQAATDRIIPWVFWHRDGQPVADFRDSWANACKKAGVPGLLLHDLRRSAVRNLERAGVSRSAAMKLTGHRTESVYRRYAIVAEADLLEAVGRLAQHRQASEAKAAKRPVVPIGEGRRKRTVTKRAQFPGSGDTAPIGQPA